MKDLLNLVWLDMEMTGLDVEKDVILEVAVIITDKDLNIIATSPSYPIYQTKKVLAKMDKWNVKTHTKTGLIDKVTLSEFQVEDVEKELLQLIKKYTYKNQAPLCGSTVHQDRKFLSKYMSKIDDFLHYRNVDVSSLKELVKRWYPAICKGFKKENKHEALADIIESINELKYYREKIFINI